MLKNVSCGQELRVAVQNPVGGTHFLELVSHLTPWQEISSVEKKLGYALGRKERMTSMRCRRQSCALLLHAVGIG